MSHIAGSLGLVNLMSHRHPNKPAPVTYARGVKCLDYALGTPKVAAAIVAAGYEAFNERFTSDHRGYFFDFDTTLLFGSPTQDLAIPQKRRLCTSHLKNTTAYIEKTYELLEAHNVIERVECLTLLGDRHSKAEAIDRDVTAACLTAESSLPAYGDAAWSVELATARKRTHVLGKLFSTMRAGRDTANLITEMINIMPPDWTPPTTIQQCSQQWLAAKKLAAEIAKNSIDCRDKELKARIRTLEQTGGVNARETATIIRRLKKAEDLKRLWQKLKTVRQTSQHQGVVRLEIPRTPRPIPRNALIGRLSTSQPRSSNYSSSEIVITSVKPTALHSPSHPYRITCLGFSGDGEGASQILAGTYNSSLLDEPVQLLINHLKYIHATANDTCRPTISDAEFCGKLRT